MKLRKINNTAGFTLIEVLIALVILAIALMAVIKVTQDSIDNTEHLRNDIVAHWVAMNVISELQVGLLAKPGQASGTSGDMQYLGGKWHWQVAIDATANQKCYYSVAVSVSHEGRRYARLVGFVTR